MIRLIMKNLWARRRKNGWLLAELILVSIVTWVIVDPLVVLTHDRNLPEGYRPDHLFLLQLASYPAGSEQFRAEENDTLARKGNFERLLNKLKHYEGVYYFHLERTVSFGTFHKQRQHDVRYHSGPHSPSCLYTSYRLFPDHGDGGSRGYDGRTIG